MKKFYILVDQKTHGDSFDEDLSGLRKKEAISKAETLFDCMSKYDQKRSTFTLFALNRQQYDEHYSNEVLSDPVYNGDVIFQKTIDAVYKKK